ncbi:MAG TPA: EAL domain-containing protein [Bacillota bacterium]|nr:EAL domain-containing protein [Bacillota bacterium]
MKKLNKKMGIFLLGIILFAFVMLYILTNLVILRTFSVIDENEIDHKVDTVAFNLNYDLNQMGELVTNYSAWDDTYAFIQKEHQDNVENDPYIESNYTDSTYTMNKFNFIILLNQEGQIVYESAFDLKQNKRISVYPDFMPYIAGPNSFLLEHPDPHSVKTGLIRLNEGLMLVASEPIVMSDYQGPTKGTFIAGRLLGNTEIAELGRRTDSEIQFKPYIESEIPPKVKTPSSLSTTTYFSKWRKVDEDTLTASMILPDIVGRPIAVLEIEKARTTYNIGEKTIHYFYFLVAAVLILVILSIFIFLNRSVISRLAYLRKTIDEIGKNKNLSIRVPIYGNDEITYLMHNFNDMMGSIEQYENYMLHQAYHDPLTNLANRQLFYDRLNHAISSAKSVENGKVVVLFVDLDQFKPVNDMYGHECGDTLLKEVAQRLRNQVPVGGLVSRLGGDEFTILLENIKGYEEIEEIVKKILRALSKTMYMNGNAVNISASIGVSIFPDHGENPESLITNADKAMYTVKKEGKNNYQLFSSMLQMDMTIEQNLGSALLNNEFVLHYQPKIHLQTGNIIGIEALIRWNHPTMGWIMPNIFIPLAENTGHINEIGDWVLRTACQKLKSLQTKGYPSIRMSVNVSGRQFRDKDFVNKLKTILVETQIKPKDLELEITENTAMENVGFVYPILEEIKDIGVKIAIDDFGKGYSSLSYLKSFPINYLKLDKSFIDGIGSPVDNMLVKTIIDLGKNLNLIITAEGVETIDQLNLLSEFQCDEVQGYLISKPLDEDMLEKFLREKYGMIQI